MVAQKVNLFKNKFPYIYVIDEASDFKFGIWLMFAKAYHKITRRRKDGCGPGLGELPEIWGFPFSFGKQLGLAKAHHKITASGKNGVAPIIFL